MSQIGSLTSTPPTYTTDTPRARRGAAAVVAQYIQDLSHPSQASAAGA